MTAYLRLHRPARGQFRSPRRLSRSPLPGKVTGCTVLHTAEGVMDSVGPDTGAEAVARYVTTRTTPGSYHDIVDSDSIVQLVEYGDEAYQDGTGSNPWALSISFACRTVDWARMTPARRAAFLRQGALAFARQQAWRRARGYPLTELRLITKAQSDRGESGFIYHGKRDPGRRSDPGTTASAPFPIAEFLAACRAALGHTPTPAPAPAPPVIPDPPPPAPLPEDDMTVYRVEQPGTARHGEVWVDDSYGFDRITKPEEVDAYPAGRTVVTVNAAELDFVKHRQGARRARSLAGARPDVDEAELARLVLTGLDPAGIAQAVTAAVGRNVALGVLDELRQALATTEA